jgi:long-chain acyl-CoA synthetase
MLSDAARRSPLLAALERQARDRARRPALASESERLDLTFADLAARIDAWTRALRAAGVRPDAPAALATGNRAAFVELFFALRALDVPVLTIDDSLPPPATLEIARRMGAGRLLHRRAAALGGAPLPEAPDPAVLLRSLDDARPAPAGTALIKLTSGSTLNPRGACFTEEALAEGIDHIARGMELGPSDRVLISIPLSHSYGFDNGVLSLAAAGTPLVLQDDLLPAALLRTLRDRAVTFFPTVPAIVRLLAQVEWPRDLPLRAVISASAPLAAEHARAFRSASGLPVRQFYGATECGGISFETRPDDPEAEGTVGFPLPGVDVETHPEEGIRVRSRANRFALLPGGDPVPAPVATGDRGERTPEGRLRLRGRILPLGNVGGVKIDLGAIDAFLRALPGVSDAAVLPVEDPSKGHRLVAWVESETRRPEEILDLCRTSLGPREVPGEIRVLPRLPRTSRGKLDRAALARRAEGDPCHA